MTKKPTAVVTEIINALQAQANPERAQFVAGYFKTGPGQYGEGDNFLGLTVPTTRKIALQYWKGVTLDDVELLLESEWHEVRLAALEILDKLYQKATPSQQKEIYDFYLTHLKTINNWDLVDSSAAYIVGRYLLEHPAEKRVVLRLMKSDNLWERRISVLSVFPLVAQNKFEVPLKIAESLLSDKHDLIHKAVGWMLRDVGDQDHSVLTHFLDQHVSSMPRTMLRYAIEHFDQTTRKYYLTKK